MMMFQRITFSAALLLCACSSISIQAQSALTAEKIWQYGRGVIYDFDWHAGNLVFSAGNHTWQVDPLTNEIDETDDFFPRSISSDGTRMAVTQGTNVAMIPELVIRETSTGTIMAIIPRSYVNREQIAWQPNTHVLALTAYDENHPEDQRHYLELWNADSGTFIGTVGGYANGIRTFQWHPDGERLVMSLTDGTIIIENAAHDEKQHEFTISESPFVALAWSPDGHQLAATSNGYTPVYVWRTDTFVPLTTENQPAFILSLAWNSESTQLAGSLLGSGVGIWNLETDEFIALGVESDDGFDLDVEQVAWQGNLLAALDRMQRLRVWNVETGTLIWESTDHEFHNRLWSFAASQDGTQIALVDIDTLTIPILNSQTGLTRQTLISPRVLHRTDDMAWSPSGKQLAVAAGNLFIWSLSPTPSADPIQMDRVDAVSWSPDDVLAATLNGGGTLRLIEGKTGEVLFSREEPHVIFPLWSPNGRYLAVYRYNPPSDDMTVPTSQIDLWGQHQESTMTILFPRGTDGQTLFVPSEYVTWLPDGSGMMGYAGGALWRWTIGASEAEILVPRPDEDTSNQGFFLSINANGRLLAVSNLTTDYQIHILDAETGQFLLELPELEDGPRLFAWGGDDLLFVYDGVLHAYRIH